MDAPQEPLQDPPRLQGPGCQVPGLQEGIGITAATVDEGLIQMFDDVLKFPAGGHPRRDRQDAPGLLLAPGPRHPRHHSLQVFCRVQYCLILLCCVICPTAV